MKNEHYWQLDNLPNRLTMFRILLIPIVITCLLFSKPEYSWYFSQRKIWGWIAGFLFTIASLTDFFDGYLARKKNLVTAFGSFLDPIADKFLVISTLIMLLSLQRIPDLIVIVLVIRELYMTSLRLFAAHEDINITVSEMGKWKTATQMIGITLLVINDNIFNIPLGLIGLILIYVSTFLSLLSAFQYSFFLMKKIQEKVKFKKRNIHND